MRKNVQDDREKKDIACKMSELHHGRLVTFYDSLTKKRRPGLSQAPDGS